MRPSQTATSSRRRPGRRTPPGSRSFLTYWERGSSIHRRPRSEPDTPTPMKLSPPVPILRILDESKNARVLCGLPWGLDRLVGDRVDGPARAEDPSPDATGQRVLRPT